MGKKYSHEINHYISWGGGVNSTAIIALHLLGKLNGRPEIVFADTSGETPKTYVYINAIRHLLIPEGWKFTILSPKTHPEVYYKQARETKTLLDYCKKYTRIPSYSHLWCNLHFKLTPLGLYAKGRRPMIGICKDENHRMKKGDAIYPLAEYTREDCKDLIRQAGLPSAHKTGCFFCRLQPKAQWIELYKNNPELWKECVELEEISGHTFKNKITLPDQMKKWIDKEKKLGHT